MIFMHDTREEKRVYCLKTRMHVRPDMMQASLGNPSLLVNTF
jgi:hypothetical protein